MNVAVKREEHIVCLHMEEYCNGKSEETSGVKRKREQEEEEKSSTNKRTVVLALAADYNDVVRKKMFINKKEKERKEGERESECSMDQNEIQDLGINNGCDEEEEYCGEIDEDVSWPQLFAHQLIIINKDQQHLLQHQQHIPMLPNTFFNHLLQL